MLKIKKTLDLLRWSGWLVVERSRDVHRVHDVKYNYGRNIEFLKEILGHMYKSVLTIRR